MNVNEGKIKMKHFKPFQFKIQFFIAFIPPSKLPPNPLDGNRKYNTCFDVYHEKLKIIFFGVKL